MDGLDNEWCLRALKAGYQIIECSEAMLDHHPAETKELKVLGKTVFKYGQDTPLRYYYQFRSFFIIHNEYHSIYNDLFCGYKRLKSILLFDNKGEYMRAWNAAKKDYKAGYFGKFRGNFKVGESGNMGIVKMSGTNMGGVNQKCKGYILSIVYDGGGCGLYRIIVDYFNSEYTTNYQKSLAA